MARLLWSLPVLALSAACASAPIVAAEKAAASALISNEQEEKLGNQLHAQLEKEGTRYVTDPAVTNYVQRITTPILQQANRDRRGIRWHVHVVDAPKTVNAFATPGGHLYVNSGLILAAENEAELAGVMAHEAGHVVGRHAARNLIQAYGLQTVAALALGREPGMLAKIAAQLAMGGTMLAHSRSQEIEADEYGARYTRGAGYDPMGLVTFFQKLQQGEGKTPAVLTWLSTHPATSERIDHLQRYIAQKNLGGGALQTGGAPTFAEVKQRLGSSATGGAGQ